MKLLITGGAGFIGSNFIIYWLNRHPNDSIINLDNLTYVSEIGNLDVITHSSGYSFIKGDITDKDLITKLISDSDCIVNFAAETHVDKSISDSSSFVHSNVIGVHSILEAVRKTGKRFHQISTDEVYGSLPLDSNDKFTEFSAYNPKNPYSATKAAADFIVRAYFNTYKLPVTISNCTNNYGPHQHPEKLIPKSILNAYRDLRVPVYGNGEQVRDWIYVIDHCSAIEAIIRKGEYGKTYLVSAESERRNIDVIKIILRIMGKEDEQIEFVEDRPGHDVRYALDPSVIKEELGWKPRFSFEEGLKMTIEHYIKNVKRYVLGMSQSGKNS